VVDVEVTKRAGESDHTTWAGNEMPKDVEIWTGRLTASNASWSDASNWITRSAIFEIDDLRIVTRKVDRTGFYARLATDTST
jgi:hypothetical protein